MTNEKVLRTMLSNEQKNDTYILQQGKLNNEEFIIVEAYGDKEDRYVNIMDQQSIEYGYSDEYTFCSDCGNIIRTSPNSYSWQPDYYIGDGFIVCNECFNQEGYQQDYIETLINECTRVNQLLTDDQLLEIGYTQINRDSYENGWHEGQNDDPKIIYNSLTDKYNNIVFSLSEQSQFYVRFDVYVKND